MRKKRHHHEVNGLHSSERSHRCAHRGANVFTCIEGGRNDLETDESNETDGIAHYSYRCLMHICRRKAAALK